ncbi:hypothetical protein ACOME3_001087 [Neoechinorhynchus agilis]
MCVQNMIQISSFFRHIFTQTITAYSPLTKGRRLNDPKLVAIANRLKVTPAQVLIAWCLHNGFVTIPKTSNNDRILENLCSLNVVLDKQSIEELYHFGDTPWGCTWDPTKSNLYSAGL